MKQRCLAQLSVAGPWGTVPLWPGLDVEMHRELMPGFTLADAIQGREDCFAPIPDLQDSPAGPPAEE